MYEKLLVDRQKLDKNQHVHTISLPLHVYVLYEELRSIMLEKVTAGSSLSFQKLNF